VPRLDRPPATLYVIGAASPRLAPERAAAAGAAAATAAAIRRAGAGEAAVLSTASRLECYVVAHGREEALAAVADGLRAIHGAAVLEDADQFVLQGAEAVRHLLRVACGLEPGEIENLDRVRHAYGAAQSARGTGPLLHRVFEGALQAGARARAESGLHEMPVPVTAATRAGAAPAGVLSRIERVVLDELEKIDDWRVRREVFATVMA